MITSENIIDVLLTGGAFKWRYLPKIHPPMEYECPKYKLIVLDILSVFNIEKKMTVNKYTQREFKYIFSFYSQNIEF